MAGYKRAKGRGVGCIGRGECEGDGGVIVEARVRRCGSTKGGRGGYSSKSIYSILWGSAAKSNMKDRLSAGL